MQPTLTLQNVMITRVHRGEPFYNQQTGQTYPPKTYIDTKDLDDRGARVQEWSVGDLEPSALVNAMYLPIDLQAYISIRTFTEGANRNTRIELSDVHIQVRGQPEKKGKTNEQDQR